MRCKYCKQPVQKNNSVNAWQHVIPYPYGLRFYCVMSGGVVLRKIQPEEPEDLPLHHNRE